jgi:hypothetical protein
MSNVLLWTTSGTSGQIFSFNGELLFYVTMVDGWHDQIRPTCERLVEALNATEKTVELKCDGPIGKSDRNDCGAPVTHIDEKGYVYCKNCGKDRKESGRRCRKLTSKELQQLRMG